MNVGRRKHTRSKFITKGGCNNARGGRRAAGASAFAGQAKANEPWQRCCTFWPLLSGKLTSESILIFLANRLLSVGSVEEETRARTVAGAFVIIDLHDNEPEKRFVMRVPR